MNDHTSTLAINGGLPVRARPWPAKQDIAEEDEMFLLETLRSDAWSAGPITSMFETAFADFCSSKYCVLVENGTTALKLGLLAVGVGPGDEVIIPGMTWPSVAAAVLECHATPVPVDIGLENFGLSPNEILPALTSHTKAIIPTHLFSSQTDILPINEMAAERDLHVIEDCAHAPGARRFGKALGTFGTAGIFSFNQKKLLACGEGGCLITNDANIFEKTLSLRHFDAKPGTLVPGTHLATEFQAAILFTQLRKLYPRLKVMEERAEKLRLRLQEIQSVFPLVRPHGTDLQTFYSFCLRVEKLADINWLRKALGAELALPISGAYQPLNEVSALMADKDPRFRTLARFLKKDLPNCRLAHHRLAIRFPHFALRDDECVDDISRALEKVLFAAERLQT